MSAIHMRFSVEMKFGEVFDLSPIKFKNMKAIQLKSHIHEIVDRIQSEQLLQALYDFLKTREKAIPGQIWENLTDSQKQEVLSSYDESEDENNLIDADSIFKRR